MIVNRQSGWWLWISREVAKVSRGLSKGKKGSRPRLRHSRAGDNYTVNLVFGVEKHSVTVTLPESRGTDNHRIGQFDASTLGLVWASDSGK